MKFQHGKRIHYSRLLMSCSVLIFAFFFVITTILELYSIVSQNEKLQQDMENRAVSLAVRLNHELDNFTYLAGKLGETSWVKHVMSDSPILYTEISDFRRTEISSEVGAYTTLFSRAEKLGIVFPRRDEGITQSGWGDISGVLSYMGVPASYRDAVKLLIQDNANSCAYALEWPAVNKQEAGVLLIQRIDTTSQARAKLMMLLSERSMEKFLGENEKTMLASVQFILPSGETLYTFSGGATNEGISYTASGIFQGVNLRYTITFCTAGSDLYLAVLVLFSFFVGSLVLALCMGWLMTQRLYRPIQQVMHHVGLDASEVTDETEAISRQFSLVDEARQKNEEQVQHYLSFARTHYLQRILWGEYDENKLQEYRIPFEQQMYFAVLLLKISEKSVSKRADLVGAFRERMAELQIPCELIESRENEFYVIVYQRDGARLKEQMEQLKLHLQTLEEYGEFDFLASDTARGVDTLPMLYHALMEQFSLKSNVLAHIERHKHFFLPIGWEEQLVHDVRAGNNRGIKKTLEQLERENLRLYGDTLALRHLAVYLLSVAHRLLDETGMESPEISDAIGRAIAASNGQLSFAAIGQAFILMCMERKAQYEALVPERAVEIRNYAQAHFCEYSMTQAAVAEHFDMTASAMSKLFKSAYGVNFMDWLREMRIDKAKAMMQEGEDNLLKISKACGYENDLTFKRAFQKCENVTPHAYWQAQQSKK